MRTNFLFFEGTSIDVVKAELEKAELKIEGVWPAVKVETEDQLKKTEQKTSLVAAVVSFTSHSELLTKLWPLSHLVKEVVVGNDKQGDDNRLGFGLDSAYFDICFPNCRLSNAISRYTAIASAVEEKQKAHFVVECYMIEHSRGVDCYSFYNPYKPNSIDFRRSYERWGRAAREILSRLGYKPSLCDAGVYLFRH